MHFHKYHGLGNDYLVIDPARVPEPLAKQLTPDWSRAICERNRGIGADGIVYGPLNSAAMVSPEEETPHFSCQIWNPDGSRAQVSGNGLRIFARYLRDHGYVQPRRLGVDGADCILYSANRRVEVRFGPALDDPIQIGLGKALLLGVDIPVHVHAPLPSPSMALLERAALVDVGNPHCVFFVQEAATRTDDFLRSLAHQLGPHVENAPQFPQRTNVQFAQIVDAHHARIEIWERGAGYTLASGSSACAVATAAVATGRCLSPVNVAMPGGTLTVDVRGAEGEWDVCLTGPVISVFQGRFSRSWFSNLTQAGEKHRSS